MAKFSAEFPKAGIRPLAALGACGGRRPDALRRAAYRHRPGRARYTSTRRLIHDCNKRRNECGAGGDRRPAPRGVRVAVRGARRAALA
eukprot:5033459-Prymnesium_polylepis.1